MTTREKLSALRALMKKQKLDAYYVPSVDPHQSEYLPECWKRRHWLSGFTGSAGDLLVTARRAALWTDGRYWLQADLELAGSGIQLMKLGLPETPGQVAWLARQLKRGQTLGVDPRVLSLTAAANFERGLGEHGIKIRYLAANLVDQLWRDRPEPSLAPISVHSARQAGESVASKLARLRAAMKEQGCKAHVIGALDVIAWLFNIRSRDILYTPVAIAYAIVTERTATIHTDLRKVTRAAERALAGLARFQPYGNVKDALKQLDARRQPVLLDPVTTNRWVADLLGHCDVVEMRSPVVDMKAVKNETQLAGFRAAHVRDGVAMVKFLRWLERTVPRGGVTELSAARQCDAFRLEDGTCQDLSFDTISGYRGNGAIIHYSVSEESSKKLNPRGIYLIDSGGQYPDGTTDITRTVTLGKPTRREKEMFTRVLKGVIRCTTTPFPKGTTGQRHELHARQPLWEGGSNYMHGTGHGIGHFLGVHEGPCALKDIPGVPLQPGHVLSIEPGHYEAGKFGIRTENMAYVTVDQKHSGEEATWYRFETLTLCPIDRRLVDKSLLTRQERAWIDDYHRRVFRELRRHLDREHREWLRRATRAL